MGWSRQERIELHDKMVVKLPEVQQELMRRFPEIVSVDLGIRWTDGKQVNEMVWRVFVKEKKAANLLKPEEMIPKEIEGLRTDVFTYLPISLEEDISSYRPMWGGAQIAASGGGSGTMGCFVTDNLNSNYVCILSNSHVLGTAAGFITGQPNAASAAYCCCDATGVATVVRGIIGTVGGGAANIIDASIARVMGELPADTRNVYYANNILEIGPVFGSSAGVMMGDVVRKRGRTTELTVGTVQSTNTTVALTGGPTYTSNQIDVAPTAAFPSFSARGDSGSALVNNRNQVVGLHFAGNGTNGYSNLVANVIAGMNITYMSSGTAGTLPLSAIDTMPPPVDARSTTFLNRLEDRLRQTQEGLKFLQIVQENRNEVMDLINDNREVKVAWNRYQGPSYTGHLVKNIMEPEHPIPDQVDGYSLQNLIIKMTDVLEQNGSRKLAAAVDDYSTTVFQFADQYRGFDSVDELLQKANFCADCGNPKTVKVHGR